MTIIERCPSLSLGALGKSTLESIATGRVEEAAPSEDLPTPSELLVGLLAAFEREGIAYTYWKSTRRVRRALAGQSDLDLLVARTDRHRAIVIMNCLGFKHWPDVPGRDQPALMSFLGYDEAVGAIRHVHVHFRLVVGHSLLKNVHAPIEDALLSAALRHPSLPIRVLDSIDEALLLIVRANLEMSVTDPVALRRWRELKQKSLDDLAALKPQVDNERLKDRAEELFSPAFAKSIAGALDAERPCGPRLRRAIARELSPFRMYGGVEATIRSGWRSALWALSGLNARRSGAPRLARRRAPGGGVLIAFVGVDGSGKSTQARQTLKWLSAEIDARRLYFGSGDGAASLFFRPFKAASRLVAATIRTKPRGASHGKISDRSPGPLYSTLFAIWAIAVALDKRAKLIAAQRALARGFVVVTDRYPQDEIPQFNDGPLLHRLVWAPPWLCRLEASIYGVARRTPPDLVIKLRVGAEAVSRREPDMNPRVVLQRIECLNELRFPGARVLSVDGAQPLEEVVSNVRRAIWDVL